MLETEIKKLVKTMEQTNEMLLQIIQSNAGVTVSNGPSSAVVPANPRSPATNGPVLDIPTIVSSVPVPPNVASSPVPPVSNNPGAPIVSITPAPPQQNAPPQQAVITPPIAAATPTAPIQQAQVVPQVAPQMTPPAPPTGPGPGAPTGPMDSGFMSRIGHIIQATSNPMLLKDLMTQHNVDTIGAATPEQQASMLVSAEALMAQRGLV